MVSFLYFDGFKIKDGRSPGITGILFDAPTATFHQDNAYTDSPLHGLWKIADDRVINSNMFVSAKYALLQHRLHARSRWAASTSRPAATSRPASRTGRSTRASTCGRRRPPTLTSTSSSTAMGASHDIEVRLRLSARVDATSGTLWPGNGILAHRELADRLARAGVPPGLRRQPRRTTSTSTSATPSRASR